MVKKPTPVKPPKGWEQDRPPDDASDDEIRWYNTFVHEWKRSGKKHFPNDEAVWRGLIPKLKFTGQ
ncbi:hypothetical protein FHETE_11408, partial [Fusarium heterosporum]